MKKKYYFQISLVIIAIGFVSVQLIESKNYSQNQNLLAVNHSSDIEKSRISEYSQTTSNSLIWVDDQASWNENLLSSTNLLISENGFAKPLDGNGDYSYTSTIKTFDTAVKATSLVFKQSPIWNNWNPISNVGPSNASDAPILISVSNDNYYFLAKGPTSAYYAWFSDDMINWEMRGRVTNDGGLVGRWTTSAEYKDGKFYIYYDSPNDQDPHVIIDTNLDDGIVGSYEGIAFDDPSDGSDSAVFRDDEDGLFHLIYEDWSPIKARDYSWDSPLAGHTSSADGVNGFEPNEHPPVIDQRTTPTGNFDTYQHPQSGTLTYEIHQPEQNAYGDFTMIKVGSQYYLFSDYEPVGQSIRTARFTSNSLYQEFEFAGSLGSGHPDPTIGFAEGQFYLITQQNTDYVSPGPWVNGVMARAGVDTDGDSAIDQWTEWKDVYETYDHKLNYVRVVESTPALLDLSDLMDGYGFQFEIKIDNSIITDVSPLIDSVKMDYNESTLSVFDPSSALPLNVLFDNQTESLKVYSKDILKYESLRLFDMSGKLLLDIRSTDFEIIDSNIIEITAPKGFSEGTYILKLALKNGKNNSIKFIINKS